MEIGEEQALCFIHEIGHRFRTHFLPNCRAGGEGSQESGCHGPSSDMVGLRNRDVTNLRIAEKEPVGEVPLLVHDPDDGVVVGLFLRTMRPKLCRRADELGSSEERMLIAGERVSPRHKAGSKVDDQRYRSGVTRSKLVEEDAEAIERPVVHACGVEADPR